MMVPFTHKVAPMVYHGSAMVNVNLWKAIEMVRSNERGSDVVKKGHHGGFLLVVKTQFC